MRIYANPICRELIQLNSLSPDLSRQRSCIVTRELAAIYWILQHIGESFSQPRSYMAIKLLGEEDI